MRGTTRLLSIPSVLHLTSDTSLSLPSRPSRPRTLHFPGISLLPRHCIGFTVQTPSLYLPLSFRGENEPSSGEETGGGEIARTSVCALGSAFVQWSLQIGGRESGPTQRMSGNQMVCINKVTLDHSISLRNGHLIG